MTPKVIIEVLSPTTGGIDQGIKLTEYKEVASVDAIVLPDPDTDRVRVLHRTGRAAGTDAWLDAGENVPLPSLGIVLPNAEIFARD